MKEKNLSVEETRKLYLVSMVMIIVWAATVMFSRVGSRGLYNLLTWVSLAVTLVCFVLHAIKMSFFSFLKIGGFLILAGVFWGLLYWVMSWIAGAIWILAWLPFVFFLTIFHWILLRLYGLHYYY